MAMTNRARMCDRKIKLIVCLLIGVMCVCVIYSIVSSIPEINHYEIVTNYQSKIKHNSVKNILFWTKFFEIPNWGLTEPTVSKSVSALVK